MWFLARITRYYMLVSSLTIQTVFFKNKFLFSIIIAAWVELSPRQWHIIFIFFFLLNENSTWSILRIVRTNNVMYIISNDVIRIVKSQCRGLNDEMRSPRALWSIREKWSLIGTRWRGIVRAVHNIGAINVVVLSSVGKTRASRTLDRFTRMRKGLRRWSSSLYAF